MINVVQLSQQMYDTDCTVLDKSTNRCNYHPNKESSEGWGVYAFPHTVTPPSEQPVMNGAYYCPPKKKGKKWTSLAHTTNFILRVSSSGNLAKLLTQTTEECILRKNMAIQRNAKYFGNPSLQLHHCQVNLNHSSRFYPRI